MLNRNLKTAGLLTASLVGLLWGASAAQANSIEITGVTTTQTAGVWDYAYTMALSANNSISASNPNGSSLFVFYDLAGLTGPKASFTAGTTAVSDWNVILENTSGNWVAGVSSIVSQGGSAVETDLASAMNARFQYVGSGLSSGGSDSMIGTAHLFSTAPPGLYGQFAARWVGVFGNTQVNTQSPLTPTDTAGAQAVPLPSAAWMGLSSIVGLAVFGLARRRAR